MSYKEFATLCLFLVAKLSTCSSVEPEMRTNSGDEEFMRVDDMIFMMSKTRAGLKAEKYRWPDGEIPYKLQSGLSDEMEEMLDEGMELLEDNTCIRFVPRTKEENYLYISYKESGCYAHVGYLNRGRQNLNLGKGCWRTGTIIHELIHTIGFSHEHQRGDRDNYVTIHLENVEKDKEHNFATNRGMGMGKMDFDYFGLPYNYASIMHYRSTAFSKNRKETIVPKKITNETDAYYWKIDKDGRPVIGLRDLTRGDVMMINNMYKGHC